jgi:hypothetical protein
MFVVMKFVQLISIFFMALLFTGAVGVDVFTHSCKEDGIEQAFVINTIDHCESEREDLPDCCQSADHEDEDDCCDDEIEHFKVDSDYSHSNSDAAPAVIQLVSNYTSLFDVVFVEDNEELIHYGIDSGPPPLLVSERLSFIQSYLI